MDLNDLLKAERFLEDISLSVKKIIFANFPRLTAEEKEEIDQEVKLKILKMAARGKKIRNFRSYVWKMVYSTALDVAAKRTLVVPLEEVPEDGRSRRGPVDVSREGSGRPLLSYLDNLTPEVLYEIKDLRARVLKAIDSLPRRRKSVLLLHIQGMDLEEIAAFLGESKPTVRHLLYRGIDSLKADMGNVSGHPERTPKWSRGSTAPSDEKAGS